MRFSDGIKKYGNENRKRIFDEIIAAAEKDSAEDISRGDDKTHDKKDKQTDKREDKTMIMNNTARIRSSKGGLIAAACAVLVVGGGLLAANHMSGKPDISPRSTGASVATDAEDSTAENFTETDTKTTDDHGADDNGTDDSKADNNKKDDKKKNDSKSESSKVDESKSDSSKADDSKADDTNADSIKADDSKAEKKAVELTKIAPIDELDKRRDSWLREASADAVRLVDGSEFIGEAIVKSSTTEKINGQTYNVYLCNTKGDGNANCPVFKNTLGVAFDEVRIMRPVTDGAKAINDGDKIFVMAKNGVQSETGEFSLELVEPSTVFEWDNRLKMYVNADQPGHPVDKGNYTPYAEYENGLYEHDVDDYLKSVLSSTEGINDLDFVNNWCAYNNIELRIYEVPITPEQVEDYKKGDMYSMSFFCGDHKANDNSFQGLVMEVASGAVLTEEEAQALLESEFEPEYDLKISDKGQVIEGFEDFNIELHSLSYDPSYLNYTIELGITKKDGSNYENSDDDMELVYGDLQPLMDAAKTEWLNVGPNYVDDNNPKLMIATIQCSCDRDLRIAGKPQDVTLEVNQITYHDKIYEGLFRVSFKADVNDKK